MTADTREELIAEIAWLDDLIGYLVARIDQTKAMQLELSTAAGDDA